MDATATGRRWDARRMWKRYGGTVLTTVFVLSILLFYWTVSRSTARSITDSLHDFRGGTGLGLLLAYVGLSLTVGAQFYTVVKRVGVTPYIRKLGGAGLWLTIRIILSSVGVLAILIHAGFPFAFRTSNLFAHGYAALATWLLLVTTVSGAFGRYFYRHLPTMKRAFSAWKPVHLVVTGLFFLFALIHVWVVAL